MILIIDNTSVISISPELQSETILNQEMISE